MNLAAQKESVEQLSLLASAKAEEAQRHRDEFRHWRQQTFGSKQFLTLSFVAGVLWGSAETGSHAHVQIRRTAMSAANFSFLAWRAVNQSFGSQIGDTD